MDWNLNPPFSLDIFMGPRSTFFCFRHECLRFFADVVRTTFEDALVKLA